MIVTLHVYHLFLFLALILLSLNLILLRSALFLLYLISFFIQLKAQYLGGCTPIMLCNTTRRS